MIAVGNLNFLDAVSNQFVVVYVRIILYLDNHLFTSQLEVRENLNFDNSEGGIPSGRFN